MLQDVFFFPQSYPTPFSLTFLFWFKCFFYTHYRFHRRQYVWDLIENHDVLSCVCSGIQSHHIEYESVFHIFHTSDVSLSPMYSKQALFVPSTTYFSTKPSFTIFSSCRYIVVVPTAISRSLKYSLISCTVTCCPCTDCRKVCYSVICFILYLAFAILTSPFQFGNHF